MSNSTVPQRDQKYAAIILDRLAVCKMYQPKFGQGVNVSLPQFLELYRADPLYSWLGLDNPLIYAAHKAAGGITSMYRQIGIGCEELFRQILMDELELSATQVAWSYKMNIGNQNRTFSLDGRIPLQDVAESPVKDRISSWIQSAAIKLGIAEEMSQALTGCVFEVRQGYKSKDSKRQNADIANGLAAFKAGYLPVILLLSHQIDEDIVRRYTSSGLLMLTGLVTGTPYESTYAFCNNILGYDLAGFFERHSTIFRNEIRNLVQTLLIADET